MFEHVSWAAWLEVEVRGETFEVVRHTVEVAVEAVDVTVEIAVEFTVETVEFTEWVGHEVAFIWGHPVVHVGGATEWGHPVVVEATTEWGHPVVVVEATEWGHSEVVVSGHYN